MTGSKLGLYAIFALLLFLSVGMLGFAVVAKKSHENVANSAPSTMESKPSTGTATATPPTATPQTPTAFEAETAPGVPKQNLTFADDISPIMMSRCVVCHQPGGIAPFALVTYKDVRRKATTIDEVISAHYMPPWKPAANFGEFSNPRCMTEGEIATLKAWIKEGKPEGEKTALEIPPALRQAAGDWKQGQPDLIVRMPKPYKVKAEGADEYRCFVFPLSNEQNQFVTNVEFHPGNPKVLHHALFFLDNTGTARKKDQEDAEMGFKSFGGPGFMPTGGLGGWAPGNASQPLPPGVVRLVRKNSDLVIQMHFHPDGKEELVQGEIGIYFAKSKPKKLLMPFTMRSHKIDIPANEKNYTVSASLKVPADFDLLQVTPHAHLLCKEIKCEAQTPDGKTLPLIWVKNWDFNWQEQYAYKNPVHLPEGSTVKASWTYDNSDDNFRNPNHPTKRVTWGEETTDEMALIFFGGTVSNNEDIPKYMRGLIFDGLKDAPHLGFNPATALKAVNIMLNPAESPLTILKEAGSAGFEPASRNAVGRQDSSPRGLND